MDDMQEFLADFRNEAGEALDRIQAMTLAMEGMQGGDNEAVNAAFRSAHSIKGGAAFLDFTKLRTVAHAFEDLLDRIRSGTLKPSSGIADVLLVGVDGMRDMVTRTDGGQELDVDPLLARIAQAAGASTSTAPAAQITEPSDGGHGAVSPSPFPESEEATVEENTLRVATDRFHRRHKEEAGSFSQFLIDQRLLKADEVVMAMIQQDEATPHPLMILREVQGLDEAACARVLELARANRIPVFKAAGELRLLPITAVAELELAWERVRPSLGQAIVWLKLSTPAQVLGWFKRYVGHEEEPDPLPRQATAGDFSMF